MQSLQLCLRAAKIGEPQAQLTVGMAYHFGVEGFPPNRRKAEKWFRAAAAQGLSDAQDKLDWHYAARNGKTARQGKASRGIRRTVVQGIQRVKSAVASLRRHQAAT